MPFFGENIETKDYSEFIYEFNRDKPEANVIYLPNQYPLLHTAICKNSIQGCRAVIDYYRERYDVPNRGRNFTFPQAINLKENTEGYTALHIACQQGNLDLVRLLMEDAKAADYIVDNKVNLLLHYAVSHLHKYIVNYLLTKRLLNDLFNFLSLGSIEPVGDNNGIIDTAVNTENAEGDTPLLLALKLNITDEDRAANRDEIIESLLNKYNDFQIKEDYQLRQLANDSYLMLAINKNIKPSIINTIAKRKFSDIDKTNADGMSALHLAVLSGNKEYVQILLENNANTALKNKDGFTALHVAVMQEKVNPEIMELLLDYAAANSHLNVGDPNNNSVLHLSAKLCDPSITTLIIDYGADVNLENGVKQTPSMLALKSFMDLPMSDSQEEFDHLLEDKRKIMKMADNQFRNYLCLRDYVDRNSNISKKLEEELNQFFTPKNKSSDQRSISAIQENLDNTNLSADNQSTRPNLKIPIETISATSSPTSSSRPLIQSVRQNIILGSRNKKIGFFTKLNNYRVSLWRQFKATKIGRYIRRHPYVSLGIATLAFTGFVALCVFAPPIAAHIPILLGISKVLIDMKILSATANILKPIAETASMVLPAAIFVVGISAEKLLSSCYRKVKNYFWPTKFKYEIQVSQADISSFNDLNNDAAKSSHLTETVISNNDFKKQQYSTTFSFADDIVSLFNCCSARKKEVSKGEYKAVSVKGNEREKAEVISVQPNNNSYAQPVI